MPQVDSRKPGKPYKEKTKGRKEKDGTESVIKLETLRVRLPNLIDLRIKAGQASATYNDAVKAVAESSGLLSATVNKFVRSRAGDNFLEDKTKAQQLALVFDELGPLDDDTPKEPITLEDVFGKGNAGDGNGRDHGAVDDNDGEDDQDDDLASQAGARAPGEKSRRRPGKTIAVE